MAELIKLEVFVAPDQKIPLKKAQILLRKRGYELILKK